MPKVPDSLGGGEGIDCHGHAGFSCRLWIVVLPAEMRAGVFREDPQKDQLLPAMLIVETAAPSEAPGLPRADPAGRLITRSGEACGIEEGLDGVERVSMDPLPVWGEAFDRETRNPGGQMLDASRGKNQIADIVGEGDQTGKSLLL